MGKSSCDLTHHLHHSPKLASGYGRELTDSFESYYKYLKVQINALEAAHDQGRIRNFGDLWSPPAPLPQVRGFDPVTPLLDTVHPEAEDFATIYHKAHLRQDLTPAYRPINCMDVNKLKAKVSTDLTI